ncbi:hypothetical protein L7F22_065621 [Adiantum nelumboides]|nr:hypothetical protein [Adiantum nelumboides]
MASLASNFARLSILRPSPPILGATLAVRHAVASTSTRGARVVGGRRQSYATISSPPSIFSIGNLKPLQPKKNVKRLGRGPSSGRGGTSTRGHKGQKARSGNGKPTPGFEGGQTPLMRRYPKRGFTNIHAKQYVVVNVSRIQDWIDQGRIDPSVPITARELLSSRCVHSVGDGVKLLGDGAEELRTPINIIVSRASYSAIEAVERVGGAIETRYYTATTLRALIKPHLYANRVLPRQPDPVSKKELGE